MMMKMIIDIPEETYDYWKEHKYEYVLSEAIANGIVFPGKPTNGDILKMLFPNGKYEKYHNDSGDYIVFCLDGINHHQFMLNWWYTSYGGDADASNN